MHCAEIATGSTIKRYYKDSEYGRPFDAYLSTLYIDGFLCDVELKVGFTVVPAHRIILASASDYFKSQFEKETIDSLDLTPLIEDSNILCLILRYIYKGEVTLSYKIVYQLLKVLDQIDLNPLKVHCAQFLMAGLRPVNGFQIWELAWRHNLHQLATVCLIFCCETLCNMVLQNGSIKELSAEFLKFVLEKEEITINLITVHVVKLIILWLSYNPFERLLEAKHLLETFLQETPLLRREYENVILFVNSYENLEIITADIIPLLQQHIFITSDNGQKQIVDTDYSFTQSDNIDNAACCEGNLLQVSACVQRIFRNCNPQHRARLESKIHLIKSNSTSRCQCPQTPLYTTIDGNRLKVKSEIILRQLADSYENFAPNWSFLVQESNHHTISLYCSYSHTWHNTYFPLSIHDPIGFVGNFLACKREGNVIILYNLEMFSWMVLPAPCPLTDLNTDDIPCLGNVQPAFFTYSGILYSVCAVTSRNHDKLSFILKKWDTTESVWIYITSVYPNEPVGDIISVSLSVKTSPDLNVFLMATVTALYNRTKRSDTPKSESAAAKNSFGFSTKLDFVTCGRNETETKVIMKPNEIFYVFKINMETLVHEEVGVRFSEPTYLDQVPILILGDRILFILDSIAKLHENFQYSYYFRKPYYINGLVLDLKDKNAWSGVALGIPLPPFCDLPIKKLGKVCFSTTISFSKNFVLIGMHRAPHIFQIAVYDVFHLQVNILSPIPLPAIRKLLLFSIDIHQPLNMTQNNLAKEVDLLSYHFKDWQLKDWCGFVE
ncbi:ring canal kelch protein isoform X2 [Octopus vulgaris]|uniref:Ring canal kelch protein isoform X2 n=1 Tax=Octopus vulgaris TaxID=6645 RepID=A0AA36AJ97_OCTVU|nr:ring canal kelch protein isoform X2 [Octopus vulgaris]